MIRLPVRTWAWVRRRWRRAALVAVVAGAGATVGLWQYAVYQWRAAQAAIASEQPADARSRLPVCLAVWPRSPEVRVLAARAARLTGDLRAAEAHLNYCMSLPGGRTEAMQLEFLLLRVQTGEADAVASALVDMVEAGHPEAPVILETLALSYMTRLRYKPAWAYLTRWIELRPDVVRAYHWRGWVLERLNSPKSATEDYHRALAIDPDHVPVRLRVAEMLLEDKQAPEAAPHLERLYALAPNDPLVQARLGQCRFMQGNAADARRLMEAAVVAMPRDPALQVALANLDLQEDRPADAERRLRAVLEAEPSDTETLFVLATALRVQGKADESKAVLAEHERKSAMIDRLNGLLKDTVDRPTATADDYAEMGETFFQIGRDKFGVQWSHRALEKDETNQRAHRALAAYYDRKGDAASAAAHRQMLKPAAAPR